MPILNKQKGSALLVSLVILTIITLGAIVALQRSTLQLRMVGGMQHQQKVFNASYSNLNALLDQMRRSGQTLVMLNDAIIDYNESAANGEDAEGLNPYVGRYGFAAPQLPDNVKEVSNRLVSLEPPTSSSAVSLKATEGSSAGTLMPYHFSSTADAKDVNDNVSSKQQIGFYYLAPAPN